MRIFDSAEILFRSLMIMCVFNTLWGSTKKPANKTMWYYRWKPGDRTLISVESIDMIKKKKSMVIAIRNALYWSETVYHGIQKVNISFLILLPKLQICVIILLCSLISLPYASKSNLKDFHLIFLHFFILISNYFFY